MKLMTILALILLSSSGAMAQQKMAQCTLTNLYYSGYCIENVVADQKTPEQACEEVRDYLNTVNSATKTYCFNTSIRGNWTLISAH